jgi:hypothetical protein
MGADNRLICAPLFYNDSDVGAVHASVTSITENTLIFRIWLKKKFEIDRQRRTCNCGGPLAVLAAAHINLAHLECFRALLDGLQHCDLLGGAPVHCCPTLKAPGVLFRGVENISSSSGVF